jgi:quinoprotein glucose dehydrogenase
MLFTRAFRLFAAANLFSFTVACHAQFPPGEGWPTYGGDPGGTRSSTSSQITRANLDKLHPVWTFHTHALGTYPANYGEPSFETTPVLSGDTLFLSSPYDVVFALDARTGAERWHFDPKLGVLAGTGAKVTSRGVALWPLAAVLKPNEPPCSRRVFIGTLDARLMAIDAANGQPCTDFGEHGSVDLRQGVHDTNQGTYSVSSPPTVVGNTVVIGSAVLDSQQVDIESGLVRGYDAVSGKLIWSWEPLPWAAQQKVRTGAGNTWSIISADPALGLVYLPTGSPSLDYYGVTRPGDDRDANSVVALDAATGKKVWAFQVVHHDLWDYDIASEPVLFTWRPNTPQATPAVAVTTKMGMIFLLDRRDGHPLVPIEERPVPQSDVPGEVVSPTQPFQNIPTLAPLTMSFNDSDSYHRSAADAEICRIQLSSLRYDGMYTPPSLRGSLHFPGPIGGVHWGGAAIDPATGILYADTNRIAFAVRLVPRYGVENGEHNLRLFLVELSKRRKICLAVVLLFVLFSCLRRRSLRPGWPALILMLACATLFLWRYRNEVEAQKPHTLDTRPTLFRVNYPIYPQRGSPYVVETQEVVDSHQAPCTPAPWGGITAVNLNTLTTAWEKPLGTRIPGEHTGTGNFGGPIVTASGLVITSGTPDPWLRVFDAATGAELQRLPLPVPAVSTPMTYTLDGRQYIVVAAGGHGDGFSALGDSLIAFAVQ